MELGPTWKKDSPGLQHLEKKLPLDEETPAKLQNWAKMSGRKLLSKEY